MLSFLCVTPRFPVFFFIEGEREICDVEGYFLQRKISILNSLVACLSQQHLLQHHTELFVV